MKFVTVISDGKRHDVNLETIQLITFSNGRVTLVFMSDDSISFLESEWLAASEPKRKERKDEHNS